MKLINLIRSIIYLVLTLSLISGTAYAGEATIGPNIAHIGVDKVHHRLAFPACDDFSNKIIITDYNLNPIPGIPAYIDVSEFPYSCEFSVDGNSIYVAIWEPPAGGPGHEYDEAGKLGVISTVDWSIVYHDLPSYPIEMFAPLNNTFVYLVCGVYEYNQNVSRLVKINKINGMLDFNVECGTPQCGGLSFNHEETKIYLDCGVETDQYEDQGDGFLVWNGKSKGLIYIFDASGNKLSTEIELDPGILDIVQGPAGSILVAHGSPYDAGDASITVISTLSDSIDKIISFPDMGFWELVYVPYNDDLFATPLMPMNEYDEELQEIYEIWKPLPTVARISLDDESYVMVEISPEPIGPIAYTFEPDLPRIFAGAAAEDSDMVYFANLY